MKYDLYNASLRKRPKTIGSYLSFAFGLTAGIMIFIGLIYLYGPSTLLDNSKSPQAPTVIQLPPWWLMLAYIAGLITISILVFLAAGPAVLYLRKYYQKFYVPAFSDELPTEIDKIAKVNPADIQQVVATQLAISSNYYETVLQQSRRSFIVAITFAAIGLTFFMTGITFIVYKNPGSFVNPSLIGGALTELLSAINFYLYGSATKQLETFHIRLDGIQRFVIANSVCENLEGDIKQTTRSTLVQAMFSGPAAADKTKDTTPPSTRPDSST